jgi:sodium transport system permease protein
LLAVSLFAKSIKEASSYATPLIILIIVPAMMGMMPGVELNARLALVPVLNIALASKELVSGVFHWNYLALIFGSTCVYAAAALAVCVRMFNREDVLFRT